MKLRDSRCLRLQLRIVVSPSTPCIGRRRAGGLEARHRCGFTLLELLIVLSLTLALVAVAAPRFSGSFSALREREAVRRLQTLLWTARHVAIEYERAVAVDLDERNQTFFARLVDDEELRTRDADISRSRFPTGRLVRLGNLEDGADPELPARARARTVQLPPRLSCTSEALPVIFLPGGYASGGVIGLIGAKGWRSEIRVDAVTGMVRLIDEAPSERVSIEGAE